MKRIFENILVLVMKVGTRFEKVETYLKNRLFSANTIVAFIFLIIISVGVVGCVKLIESLVLQFDIANLIFLIFAVLLIFLFIVLTYSLIKNIKIIRDDEGFKVIYPTKNSIKEISELKSVVQDNNIKKSLIALNKKHMKSSPDAYTNFLRLEPLKSKKIIWCDRTGSTRYKNGNLQTLLEFIKITFDLTEEEHHLMPEIVDNYFLNANSKKFKFHQNTLHRWRTKESKYISTINCELKNILF